MQTEQEEVDKASIPCHLNSAACYLKLEEWDEAKESSNGALELSPGDAKGLYRRGVANTNLEDYDAVSSSILLKPHFTFIGTVVWCHLLHTHTIHAALSARVFVCSCLFFPLSFVLLTCVHVSVLLHPTPLVCCHSPRVPAHLR